MEEFGEAYVAPRALILPTTLQRTGKYYFDRLAERARATKPGYSFPMREQSASTLNTKLPDSPPEVVVEVGSVPPGLTHQANRQQV